MAVLPTKYKWLSTVGPLPKMVVSALSYLGLKEYPGSANNPVIMEMARQLGVTNIYSGDSVSWCAVFISYICLISGKPMPFTSYEILRAASFASWGNPVEKGKEALGDILVFKRPGGNHVGIYIAESATTFHVLGGNQSDSVSFTEIKKDRMIACRRYYAVAAPASVKKYILSSGGKVSTNED
jgi:uncharacterized protein (TIGR02594 family)